MAVSRIKDALNLNSTGRFIVVFGNFIQEVFISEDLELCSKELILYKYLKKEGYQRILFFDSRNRIHCYDEESLKLCQFNGQNNTSESPKTDTRNQPSSGNNGRPLGGGKRRKIISKKNSNTRSFARKANPLLNSRGFYQVPCSSNDSMIADELDKYIRSKDIKTAILIKFSELGMDPNSFSRFLNVINGWGSINIYNENKCFLIYNSPNDNSLNEEVRNRSMIRSIIDSHNRDGVGLKSLLHLSYPKPDEIKRLIQYKRLGRNLEVNWLELNSVIKSLDRDLQSLAYWTKSIDSLKVLNKKTLKSLLKGKNSSDDRTPQERLNSLIGLNSVKKTVEKQLAIISAARLKPELAADTRMHLTFEGNPGTGKTTVARIVSEIYQETGVLSRGHLIEADRESLVGGYLGQSAIKTKELVNSALGGILFIDEAYALGQSGKGNTDQFGQEAINTLLKLMEDHKNDLCVIFAGYPKEMESFLNTNPGLKRRVGNRISFEDYNPDELFRIFELKKKLQKLSVSTEVDDLIKKILIQIYKQKDSNFGNAGEVEKILTGIKQNFSLRCIKNDLDPNSTNIEIKDIPEVYQVHASQKKKKSAAEKLSSLIGLNGVKRKIKKQLAIVKAAQIKPELAADMRMHLTFDGNPGTGKTTVARIIAEIYQEYGVLSKGHLIEADRESLVGGYVGQTAIKTKELVKKALGGVLFIDEAYALGQAGSGRTDQFGQEAIDTLLKLMEDHKDDLCVIFAGYPREMESFLNTNPGLKRRIGGRINFDDYNEKELYEIYELKKKLQKLSTTLEFDKNTKRIIIEIYKNRDKNFGNAGEVEKFLNGVKENFSLRCLEGNLDINTSNIEAIDIPQQYIKAYLNGRINSGAAENTVKKEVPSFDINHAFFKKQIQITLPEKTTVSRLNKKEINANISNSTGIIKSEAGIGTAFCISPYGHLITCYHVIENTSQFNFRFNNSNHIYSADLISFNPESDLAILKIKMEKNLDLPYSNIVESNYTLSIGLEIAILGFPEGEKHSNSAHYSGGTVMNIDTKNEIKNAFSIEVTAKEGNSGSPIYLRETGDVIGILFGKPQGFNSILATSHKSIYELVNFIIPESLPIPPVQEKISSIKDNKNESIDNKLETCVKFFNHFDYFILDSNVWLHENKAVFSAIRNLSLISNFSESNKIYMPKEQYDEIINLSERLKHSKNDKDRRMHKKTRQIIVQISKLQASNSLILEPLGANASASAYADAKFVEFTNKVVVNGKTALVVTNDIDLTNRILSNNRKERQQNKVQITNIKKFLNLTYPMFEHYKKFGENDLYQAVKKIMRDLRN